MADQRTVFTHGTIGTPEWANAITRPVYRANPEHDGEIKPPTRTEMSDVDEALTSLKSGVQTIESAIADLEGTPAALADLIQLVGRLQETKIYEQHNISAPAGFSPWIQSDELPIGTYLCSGFVNPLLPGDGPDGWTFSAYVTHASDESDYPPAGQVGRLGWNGHLSLSWLTVAVPSRLITLTAPGRIYLRGGPSTALTTSSGVLVIQPRS